MASAAAWADTGQTVVIDGAVTDGFVNTLTFEGDNVTMTFADGTVRTADMSLVSIDLIYDDPSAITDVTAADNSQKRVYTISGQYVGTSTEGLARGLYIVGGKKTVIY